VRSSLRTRLSLSYMLIAMICVFLISIFANFFLERQFRSYIMKNQERKNKEIVELIKKQYTSNGLWRKEIIENIGVSSLEQGLIVKLKDSSGKVIWDAMAYNHGMCQQMMFQMSQNMYSRYPNFKGGYKEDKYSILVNLKEVGIVEIGYYGPFYFNENDLIFINTLNRILVSVGLFSLILALLTGIIMAKRLSMPISRVISTARMISRGSFEVRSFEKSDIKEINELTLTINNLAENLEKNEMLRQRLTSDVAHELRTPLTTLQGYLEAMIDGVWRLDSERLKSCHEEVIRINRLVGDLEKLSKYENQNLKLNKTNFNVSELIRGLILNFEHEYLSKRIEVTFRGEEEMITADKDKITQVLINLMSNSLKYTPEHGKVEIEVKDLKDKTQISVKDNGVGISEEDLPFIFERFYRADKSRSRITGGAGIGLAITKSIIEAHKGSIKVNSKLNEGTEFIVLISKKYL
jgi:two-component system, OmpR family, sensor histidine kinase BaeS